MTDSKRLQQVLKNLLSNAFKFTSFGGVELKVDVASDGWTKDHPILGTAETVVSFRVTDTGIGIQPDKQKLIFEAFQQADAGTSRKYGGTGLGLAISRELASLLGGEIVLHSAPDKGSTFTLYLPLRYVGPLEQQDAKGRDVERSAHVSFPAVRSADPAPLPIPDDRVNILEGEPVMLIVEDDPSYARIIIDLARATASRFSPPLGGRTQSTSFADTGRPRCLWTSSCRTCSVGRCSAS